MTRYPKLLYAGVTTVVGARAIDTSDAFCFSQLLRIIIVTVNPGCVISGR